MGSADYLREHDFNRICDRCGFKVKASDTAKEWTGAIVCRSCYESRHPQDFVRGRRDKQTVPDPRPSAAPVFVNGDIYVDESFNEYIDDSGFKQYVSN